MPWTLVLIISKAKGKNNITWNWAYVAVFLFFYSCLTQHVSSLSLSLSVSLSLSLSLSLFSVLIIMLTLDNDSCHSFKSKGSTISVISFHFSLSSLLIYSFILNLIFDHGWQRKYAWPSDFCRSPADFLLGCRTTLVDYEGTQQPQSDICITAKM